MKKIRLLIPGLIPFALGFGMNARMTAHMNLVLLYKGMGAVWLMLWGFCGYRMKNAAGSPIKSAAIAHLIPGAVLLLLLYQELILGRYWLGLAGIATQFYYLPLLNIAFMLERIPMMFVGGRGHPMWHTYLIAFGLMGLSFYLGNRWAKRRAES